MKLRVLLAVCALWILAALLWASQTMLGAGLQGTPLPATQAVRTALMQTLPWIPVTLAISALATRWPVTRATWRRTLPVHLVAFPLLVWVQNVLVVLEYAMLQANPPDVATLLRNAGRWTLLRIHVAALVYIAIAGITQTWAWYRRSRARELQLARLEGQLARARLDALTAQIRPHFLFNTLHTIGHLWRSGRAEEADAMLDHLGTLFQRVQETTSRPLISLEEELETVASYLAIESARFRDRMHVDIDAPADARALAVPPLLLQPIVENAVRHGIAPDSAAGRIRVTGRRDNGRLIIEVEDDGPGFAAVTPARGTGTGIANTRERLGQLFGGEERFEIGAAPGRGTRVRIEMPARRPEDDA